MPLLARTACPLVARTAQDGVHQDGVPLLAGTLLHSPFWPGRRAPFGRDGVPLLAGILASPHQDGVPFLAGTAWPFWLGPCGQDSVPLHDGVPPSWPGRRAPFPGRRALFGRDGGVPFWPGRRTLLAGTACRFWLGRRAPLWPGRRAPGRRAVPFQDVWPGQRRTACARTVCPFWPGRRAPFGRDGVPPLWPGTRRTAWRAPFGRAVCEFWADGEPLLARTAQDGVPPCGQDSVPFQDGVPPCGQDSAGRRAPDGVPLLAGTACPFWPGRRTPLWPGQRRTACTRTACPFWPGRRAPFGRDGVPLLARTVQAVPLPRKSVYGIFTCICRIHGP